VDPDTDLQHSLSDVQTIKVKTFCSLPRNGEGSPRLSLPVVGGLGHEHGAALRDGGGKETGGEGGEVERVHAHCACALAKQGHLHTFFLEAYFSYVPISI